MQTFIVPRSHLNPLSLVPGIFSCHDFLLFTSYFQYSSVVGGVVSVFGQGVEKTSTLSLLFNFNLYSVAFCEWSGHDTIMVAASDHKL